MQIYFFRIIQLICYEICQITFARHLLIGSQRRLVWYFCCRLLFRFDDVYSVLVFD